MKVGLENSDWRITFYEVAKNHRRDVKIIQVGFPFIVTETSQTIHRHKPTGITNCWRISPSAFPVLIVVKVDAFLVTPFDMENTGLVSAAPEKITEMSRLNTQILTIPVTSGLTFRST
jgi:uncharacterized membrane protein YGL010W